MFKSYQGGAIHAIACYVLYSFIFSVITVLTKSLMQDGISIVQILFFQCFFACVLLLIHDITPIKKRPGNKAAWLHFIRALFWLFGTALFFIALEDVNIARATALSFTTPIFTMVLAFLFFKEAVRGYHVVALVLGIIGMVIIIKPDFLEIEVPALMIIVGCVLWSVTDIIIKHLGVRENPSSMTWYYSFFASLLLLPILPFYWQGLDMFQLVVLLCVSGLFAINMLLLTHSYKLGDLTVIQPFAFTNLVFATALAYILFDEVVIITTVIGSVIIVAGNSLVAYKEHSQHLANNRNS